FSLFSSCSVLLSTAKSGDPRDTAGANFPFSSRSLRGEARRRVVAGRLFFPCYLQEKTGAAGVAFARCRRRRRSLPHAVSAGGRVGGWFSLALLPPVKRPGREGRPQRRGYAV